MEPEFINSLILADSDFKLLPITDFKYFCTDEIRIDHLLSVIFTFFLPEGKSRMLFFDR